MKRWATLIGGIGLLVGFAFYVGFQREGWATGYYHYRVTARFVDADTDLPIEGVAVQPHPLAPSAGDWTTQPCTWIHDRDEWYDLTSDPTYGAVSDATGAFVLVFDRMWCIGLGQESPPLFYEDTGVFVIGKPGYAFVEVPWRRGKQLAHRAETWGEPDASIDLGTIPLTRNKPR